MKRRTAKQGPNAGGEFWGCSKYPRCRGTRDIGDGPTQEGAEADWPAEPEARPRRKDSPMPVPWDAAAPPGYVAEYAAVGALPGVALGRLRIDERLQRALGQCVLYSRRDRDRTGATPQARLLGALLVKLLQRGRAPLATLEVENTALRVHAVLEHTEDLSLRGVEMGWTVSGFGDSVDPDVLVAALSQRREFVLDAGLGFRAGDHLPEMGLGSPVEERFLTEWVPAELGSTAGHWFTPQAPLERIAESLSGEAPAEDVSARRVDFLFCHPSGTSFVVELDGTETPGRLGRRR